MMTSRLIAGAEGLVFALLLSYLAAALTCAIGKRLSDVVSAIWGLTTAAYVLLLVWSVGIHRFRLPDPTRYGTSLCIGLIVGSVIYALTARSKSKE